MSAQFIYFLIYCELYCEFQISHAYLHLHKLQGEWAQDFGAKVYGIVWVTDNCFDWSTVPKSNLTSVQSSLGKHA